MQAEEQWMLFRSFDEPRAAEGLCLWLRNEQIAARTEGGDVFVPESQRHRAHWILEHLPPSDEDLRMLAASV